MIKKLYFYKYYRYNGNSNNYIYNYAPKKYVIGIEKEYKLIKL